MSTQKGNTTRKRPQKYQNKKEFKNNLHDTSRNTKFINSLEIDSVCARCKSIIEWKIKYKKYKPLKSPSTCVKCSSKNVKHAYHIMCAECSKKLKMCPKCGEQKEFIETSSANVESILRTYKVQDAIKSLTERKRRTFYRQLNNSLSEFNSEQKILKKLSELSLGSSEGKFSINESIHFESDEFDSDFSFD